MGDDKNDETAKSGDSVTSQDQSGGISAHTVKKDESLIGDLHIDKVEQLNVYQIGDRKGFTFEMPSPASITDSALADFSPSEMLATGSTNSLTATANVSGVMTGTVFGSSEIELKFYNALEGDEFDITSSQNTPKFTVAKIDSHSVTFRFDNGVPKKLGIRIDSKPRDKK